MTTHHASSPPLVINDRDHIRGPKDALVTLLEFGDYECPYCGVAHPVVEEIRRRMGNRLRFVFRHFPLTQVHPHAEPAAESAEAAGAQGKFWPMHDTLYANQQALDGAHLMQYARWVGVSSPEFINGLASHRFQGVVHRDFLSGVRAGVNGTPSFFIEGVRFDGVPDVDSLLMAVEAAADAKEE